MGSSGPDTLLTELCAICHTNPLKYTCPRCGIHTCSLACVKRHKSWAQCSGVHDPAAFKKRQDLATPASIDQDYNFITKVERTLQRADDSAFQKGIDLAPAGIIGYFQPAKTKFDWEIEANNTVIVRAPKGLSRSKQNKSRWDHKKRGLYWTVEFILPDGVKAISNVPASKSISEACRLTAGRKITSQKRKLEEVDTQAKPGGAPQADVAGREEASAQKLGSTSIESALEGLRFYLHRPNIPSKFKCLIPVSHSESIQDALRGRTVLEYPTFYVRHELPEELQEPFITEATYLEKHGSDLPANLPRYGLLEDGEIEAESEVDSKKVLEVLQKDMVG